MEPSTPPIQRPFATAASLSGLGSTEAIAIIAAGVVAGITVIICCIILCSRSMAKRAERLHKENLRKIAVDTTLKIEELDRKAGEIHRQEEAEGLGRMMEEEYIDDAVVIGTSGAKSSAIASPSQMARGGAPSTQQFAPTMPIPGAMEQNAMMAGMMGVNPMMSGMMLPGLMGPMGPMSPMGPMGPISPMGLIPPMGPMDVGSNMGITPLGGFQQTPPFQTPPLDQGYEVANVPEYQYEYYYGQASADGQPENLQAQQHLLRQLQMQTNTRQRVVTPPSLPAIQAGEQYSVQA